MRTTSFTIVTLLLAQLGGCAGDPRTDRRAADVRPEPASGQAPLDVEAEMDVVFSPQPADRSHLVRVAELVEGAESSIDVAMYSFTDERILDALGAAVDRGVRVRFLLDDANADPRSGKLERRGVDVRFVNKILHHKLMIVDGPRDDLDAAHTAWVATGSANWSRSAATRYDESTLFSRGHAELALRLQAELNLLWEHSRDFVRGAPFSFERSLATIDEDAIPDDPGFDAFFTSDNFTVRGDTFTTAGTTVVSDELVRAIEAATASIHIASTHLRSRPIAEALIDKKTREPDIDIRIYLDGQEHISASWHAKQERELRRCVADARRESEIEACRTTGFHFGYEVGRAGIDVRYKYYAYRWDPSYAPQMHHKYLIIDGDVLYTGPYNLSDNAERETFENLLRFQGPEHRALIERYQDNFARIRETGRADGLLDSLSLAVQQAPEIPLVFDPMALTWEEITDLKALLRAACPAVDSDEYRDDPPAHHTCPRP